MNNKVKFLMQSNVGLEILLANTKYENFAKLDNANILNNNEKMEILQNYNYEFVPKTINDENIFYNNLILSCYNTEIYPLKDLCKLNPVNEHNENLLTFFDGLGTGLINDLPLFKYTKFSLATKLLFLINPNVKTINVNLYTTKIFQSIKNPWFVKKFIRYSILRNYSKIEKLDFETNDNNDADEEMQNLFNDNEDEDFIYTFYENNDEFLLMVDKKQTKNQYVLYMDDSTSIGPVKYKTGIFNKNESFQRLNILQLTHNGGGLEDVKKCNNNANNDGGNGIKTILRKLNIDSWNLANENEPVFVFENYLGSVVENLKTEFNIPTDISYTMSLNVGGKPFNYSTIRKNIPNIITEEMWDAFSNSKIIRMKIECENYTNLDEMEMHEFYTILMAIAMIFRTNCIIFVQRFLFNNIPTPNDTVIPINLFSTTDTNKIIHLNKFENQDFDYNDTVYIAKTNNSNDLLVCTGNNVLLNSYKVSEPWLDNVISIAYSKIDGNGLLTTFLQESPYFSYVENSFILFEQPIWLINKKKSPTRKIDYKKFKIIKNLDKILDLFENFTPQILDEINLDDNVSLYRIECQSVNYPVRLFDLMSKNDKISRKTSNFLFKSFTMWIFSCPSSMSVAEKKNLSDTNLPSIWPYEDVLVVKLTEQNYGNVAISTLYNILSKYRLKLL